jgi:hypothetical protein
MDYTEIKERLTACEIKLQALQNSNQDVKNTQQYNMAVKKLTVLKESLQKRLNEKIAVGPKTPKSDSSKIAAKLGVPSKEVETAIDTAKKDQELVTVAEREITTEDKIKAILGSQNKSIAEGDFEDKLSRAARKAAELSRSPQVAFHRGDTPRGKMERPNLRVYPKMHGVDEDLDIGHEDDEPSMVKKDLYDIINYAAKLYKQIDKYDGMDAEVDFPQWWQKKVILARDYMSAAQHYLESEEKQPAIDQLALENKSIKEERKLNYSDFVRMTADDMKAGAASDEYASDEKIKKVAKSKYNEYLQGVKVDDLFEGPAGPSIDKMSRADMIDFLNLSAKVAKDMSDEDLRDAVKVKNSDMNEKTDYQKRREAESDYKPSKRDVPPRKYREPKNDYFARRKADEFTNEGTDLYDRNGIQITRFSGGSKGVMVQISYGGKYIHVPASEYPFLVRAMQSAKEDLKDMSRQLPRDKNMEEASHGKIQKDYDALVAKMKELAKLYKSGDTSVVGQLKDMTAKKKSLEAQLDKAVAGTNRNQQLDPNINEYRGVEDDIKAIIRDKAADSGFDEQEEAKEVMEFIGQEYGIDFEFGAGPSRQAEETIKEEKATCCGKCGRVHVKGTKCKTPYLKGKDHCRYN